MQFRGEKYLNTFIVTNTNDCPSLLSHGATFRMGVLLPNYPEENVVKGENVPNFKINTSTGISLNVFQILQDLQLKQYNDQYHSHTIPTDLGKVHCTVPHLCEGQYPSSTMPIDTKNAMITVQCTAQLMTSFRTTTPSTATTARTTTKQVNPVHIHPETSCKAHLETVCMSTNPLVRSVNQVNH